MRFPGRVPAVGVVVGLALGALGAVAGCGVPLDDNPRPLTQVTTPPETTPTTSGSPTADTVDIFFVDGDSLRAEAFPVDDEPTMEERLGYVLTGRPTEPLVTRIPPGTLLLGVEVTDHTAAIDLSDEINDISGEPQKQAYGQLVFTALEHPGVTRVRFLVEGEPVRTPTDNGNIEVVTAEDFEALRPR